MDIKITKKNEQISSAWMGGTTTQLAIYPLDSSYKKSNFCFRISTATVNIPESDFTRLPEVNRIIMILEGNLQLYHEGENPVSLRPLEAYSFLGEIETKGVGIATDFNLMLRGRTKGEILGLSLKHDQVVDVDCSEEDYLGVYIFKGEAIIQTQKSILGKGDFALIKTDSNCSKLNLKTGKDSVLIITKIRLSEKNKGLK
ncbi:MAG: HutD family protein [Candidatus Cloacimonetes bacterium]|nr:HutD family protein [Candidatus Cloacimonadota bacterium]